MQALCMPLLNNPITSYTDLQPSSDSYLFYGIPSNFGGGHRPNYGFSLCMIDGSDDFMAIFFISDENRTSNTGFDTCNRGHGDGDSIYGRNYLVNTIEVYKLDKYNTLGLNYWRSNTKYVPNQINTYIGSHNVTQTWLYTPEYIKTLNLNLPNLKLLYEFQEDLILKGIRPYAGNSRASYMRSGNIKDCGYYRVIGENGTWVGAGMPNKYIGKKMYQLHIFNRNLSPCYQHWSNYNTAILDTKSRLARGGQVIYSLS